MVRNEDEGGQAEVVWTCYEERRKMMKMMIYWERGKEGHQREDF